MKVFEAAREGLPVADGQKTTFGFASSYQQSICRVAEQEKAHYQHLSPENAMNEPSYQW